MTSQFEQKTLQYIISLRGDNFILVITCFLRIEEILTTYRDLKLHLKDTLLSFLFLFFKYLLPRDLIRESARIVQLSVDVVSALFGSTEYYVIIPLLFSNFFLF